MTQCTTMVTESNKIIATTLLHLTENFRFNTHIDHRAPDKVCIFISIMPISSPNPTFDHSLESSYRDDSNKWSNIGFGEEITQVESIEVHFTPLIWSSGSTAEPK